MLTFEILDKKIFIESPIDPIDSGKAIDDVVEKYSVDDNIPFWIEVWPSAVVLAEFILGRDEFTNKKVLELGCGLGLTSVALGLKDAIITATDYEMMALQYARRNYIRNIGDEKNAKFIYLDWRHPFISEKFDFVIGADIIYERSLFGDLVNVLKATMMPQSINPIKSEQVEKEKGKIRVDKKLLVILNLIDQKQKWDKSNHRKKTCL